MFASLIVRHPVYTVQSSLKVHEYLGGTLVDPYGRWGSLAYPVPFLVICRSCVWEVWWLLYLPLERSPGVSQGVTVISIQPKRSLRISLLRLVPKRSMYKVGSATVEAIVWLLCSCEAHHFI